ncbi:MAG: FAD-binding and (Fe-S)-binding domain-containing protein, partial [Marinilabiliaceae bacterium]
MSASAIDQPAFQKGLKRILPSSRIFTSSFYTLAKGTDAGFYRLVPRMVVKVEDEAEMVRVISLCYKSGVAFTFKAGGTSLSGQTVTEALLIETGSGFSGYNISVDGKQATFQCGVPGGIANSRLAPYRRKLGPSPASVNSARIGGIVSNNASGSSYGIRYNSYNTLRGMRLVMYDGSILDTRDPKSKEQFATGHPGMMKNLTELAERAKSSSSMRGKITHKFELKNTCGYGVNALVDYEDAFDVLEHLMVGSEGTLGFISEVTFETVPELPLKAAAMVYFRNIRMACEAVVPLRSCHVSAAELMDRNALRSVQDQKGMPAVLQELDDDAVALLIDTSAGDEEELRTRMQEIEEKLAPFSTLYPVKFTRDPVEYDRLWKVRKGLFTSAAAGRPTGTACIIEDLAFRASVLGDALEDLRKLIEKYGYEGSVIWGHLLDGNIHFVIMPDFNDSDGIRHYQKFMDELVEMVVDQYDGSLKAEHGTGRNMAPFVRREWGDEIYGVMREIKNIFDPSGLINPGVLINDDPAVHLKNIKPLPPAHEMIDACIECGFCELNCPSKDVTLTPRQRIVLYREMQRLSLLKDGYRELARFKKAFDYHGEATCATDGLCELGCPVGINTGKLVKELRFEAHSAFADKLAWWTASHMEMVTTGGRSMLSAVRGFQTVLGDRLMSILSTGLFKITRRSVPLWNPFMPGGARKVRFSKPEIDEAPDDAVVYFPTCINRTMGKSQDYGSGLAVVEATEKLLQKAGFRVIYPENVDKLCCGMAFDSKGFRAQGQAKARELDEALLKASRNGRIPIYCDMSPCLLRMKETLSSEMDLYEPVTFILKYFPSRLKFDRVRDKIAIHTTCSSTKMELGDSLKELAGMCAREVVVPDEVGCCGWAGDRGFTHPELNAAALRPLRRQLPPDVEEGFSTSRTCEIGLTLHSGISYKSIVYLVDEAT